MTLFRLKGEITEVILFLLLMQFCYFFPISLYYQQNSIFFMSIQVQFLLEFKKKEYDITFTARDESMAATLVPEAKEARQK